MDKNKEITKTEIYTVVTDSELRVQMLEDSCVHAGFPSPVEAAYQAQPIDLNKELVSNPASSFLMRVVGDSMIDEGIDDGDIIIVDRSLFPTERSVAVVQLEGEFALKRILQRNNHIQLLSGNPAYPPITIYDRNALTVYGVVCWVLKKK